MSISLKISAFLVLTFATMDQLPDDYFVTSTQFKKHVYRDAYPSIDPTSPALSQKGKVIIITGASRGLDARVC
jgi:hypothetical protein